MTIFKTENGWDHEKGERRMNGLGYVPICSSSSVSKTCKIACSGDYCALF